MHLLKSLCAWTAFTLLATPYALAQEDITIHHALTNQDISMQLPLGMTTNTDSIRQAWSIQHRLITDTGCVHQGTPEAITPQLLAERIKRLPTIIPMTYNKAVDLLIRHYTEEQRSAVAFMLGASNFYTPIFEEALDRYRLPLELKYLPMVLAGLDPLARGEDNKMGLWQLSLYRAARYDLTENSLIDERKDAIRASDAAARYLRDLYAIYGDWDLTITAYVAGQEMVDKAITRAGNKRDYWSIAPFLPQEDRAYVPAFTAANYIAAYYCQHGIAPMMATLPATTDTIMVTHRLYMEQIADLCHVDLKLVQMLNPQYTTHLIPGDFQPMALRLPIPALNAFLDAKDAVYTYNLEELQAQKLPIVLPENFENRALEEQETMTKERKTTTQKAYKRVTQRKATRNKRSSRTITIRRGETLSTIAARHGISVKQLKRMNNIRGNAITAGKKLKVK